MTTPNKAGSGQILTPEQFEAIMANDPEAIKTGVKALFAKGDIIEVRAWDKQHNVFTGRYKYGTKLVADLILFGEEGECDIYYVLNPVGNKHGERTMQGGGLCTWEVDVPFRRRFLLDFDPKRDNKIATRQQWEAVFDAAYRAKTWMETYGFKGIVLASSGNGCHLLVPCNLPNDTESKEIVRRAQRAVAEKFNTDSVECECFPDANRLVRAYGSVNRKGTATEDIPHRMSEILIPAKGVDDDPKSMLLALIKDNPVADSKTVKHNGSGEGPFNRDLLFTRLEAWVDGFEGDNGEEFEFEETDRRDGFRVRCPGSFEDGWPDGEEHESVGESLNDSTIVYVENGWPRFSCRHNHCGEGAEHGKKTWKDLQDFYDKERKLHRILDEHDYAAKWMIDYVDDGLEDKGTVDVDKLFDDDAVAVKVDDKRGETLPPVEDLLEPETSAVTSKRAPASEWKSETTTSGETPAKEPTVAEVVPVTDAVTAEPVAEGEVPRVNRYDMPEVAMYGWLGDCARELETPLGYAYPAVVTLFCGQFGWFPKHVRPTLYTALVGPVHCGKSETIKRAKAYIVLRDIDTVKTTVPGSDRGLIKIFGLDKRDDKDKDATPVRQVAKARVLVQDELRSTLAKAGIQNSSLPSTLCSLWSEDDAGTADKTGSHEAVVKLNILGALKADDSEDFADVFGKESTGGLYDRFIYGLAPKGWRYKKWERHPVSRMPKNCNIPDYCYTMMNEWRDVEPIGRGRLAEIALRIAYITSAANQDSEITAEAMKAALAFVDWQEVIRSSYKAGLGSTDDAICTSAILGVLEKLEPGMWVRWRELATKKNWYRKYGSRTLSSVRDALAKSGLTIEETEEEDEGKPKRTGRIRLRGDKDEQDERPRR